MPLSAALWNAGSFRKCPFHSDPDTPHIENNLPEPAGKWFQEIFGVPEWSGQISLIPQASHNPQTFNKLRWHVCGVYFARMNNVLTKKALKFSPKFLGLYSVGPKKSRKIPTEFPNEKFKQKIHRRASAGAQGE